MALKMKCPNCGKMLKELGDDSKGADGEYIVYDSLPNSINKAGDSRILECLSCGMSDRIGRWADYDDGLLDLPTNNEVIVNKVSKGGGWLGAARRWMQSNVIRGDSLPWSSGEIVHIQFKALEDLAKTVAVATLQDEQNKPTNINKPTFTITDELFLEVINECQNARKKCPQHIVIDDHIELLLLNKNNTLWKYSSDYVLFIRGYCRFISNRSLDILNDIEIYKINVEKWNRNNPNNMILDFE